MSTDGVFLVATVEKVLSEDSDHFVDWYSKEKVINWSPNPFFSYHLRWKIRKSPSGQLNSKKPWKDLPLLDRLYLGPLYSCLSVENSLLPVRLTCLSYVSSKMSTKSSKFRLNKANDVWQYLDEVKTQKAKIKHNFGTLACKIHLHQSGSYKGDRLDSKLNKVLPFSGKVRYKRFSLNSWSEGSTCERGSCLSWKPLPFECPYGV